MRLATVQYQGQRRTGRMTTGAGAAAPEIELFDASSHTSSERGLLPLVEAAMAGAPWPAASTRVPLSAVKLLAPIPVPRRNLFCVGRNYHAHAQELQASVFKDNTAAVDSWPIVFSKVPETVVGPGDAVRFMRSISQQVDYEAELTIVIGKGGRNISRAQALDHVFGYTIINDVTARDVQMRHAQWHLGKSFDTFCPMGPWLVTADELDGSNTRVRCWVNGDLRQDARTTDLIFDIPALIETCSRGITLHPGDLIATGTAAGVGMGMKPPQWLKHGDVVRIAIDGLGELENHFVQEDL